MSEFVTGKGNMLDLCREELGPQATGWYKRFDGSDPEVISQIQAMVATRPEEYLIRSDAGIEDQPGISFAGLNHSEILGDIPLETVVRSIATPWALASLQQNLIEGGNKIIAQLAEEVEHRINVQIEGRKHKKLGRDVYAITEGMDSWEYKNLGDKPFSYNPFTFRRDLREAHDLRKRATQQAILEQKLFAGATSLMDLPDWFRFDDQCYGKSGGLSIIERAQHIQNYARLRGVTLQGDMDFILHQKAQGEPLVMWEHPNVEGLIHLEWQSSSSRMTSTEFFKDDAPPEWRQHVSLYEQLSEMPVDPSWSYIMESTTCRKVLQVRPGMKKKKGAKFTSQLGVAPDDGLYFEPDGDTYKGLVEIESSAMKQHPESAYVHVAPETRMVVVHDMLCADDGSMHYLDHAGLQVFEAAPIFRVFPFAQANELDALRGKPVTYTNEKGFQAA